MVLADVVGFRTNAIVGVGLVVGLNGTGDDASSFLTRRPLAALLKHLGSVIDPNDIKARNVAIVMVTANLPPFARPGMAIDVVVSSAGTAKSLQGGTLIETALKGPDHATYALAQGALALGGFTAQGGSGSTSAKNHATVGRIPGGGMVEREAPAALPDGQVVLLLHDPDFTTASRIAAAVNKALGDGTAEVRDPAAVRVAIGGKWKARVVDFVARLEAIEAAPDAPARVVIDERTGTVVVGATVALGPASVAHGGLSVKVAEHAAVSQPNALAPRAQTVVTPESELAVDEGAGKLQPILKEAATVADVAAALNALGVKPRDLVAIFQALKAAGALRAAIEVL
jgi:flagellar P-ring protein precursor FlgI